MFTFMIEIIILFIRCIISNFSPVICYTAQKRIRKYDSYKKMYVNLI